MFEVAFGRAVGVIEEVEHVLVFSDLLREIRIRVCELLGEVRGSCAHSLVSAPRLSPCRQNQRVRTDPTGLNQSASRTLCGLPFVGDNDSTQADPSPARVLVDCTSWLANVGSGHDGA